MGKCTLPRKLQKEGHSRQKERTSKAVRYKKIWHGPGQVAQLVGASFQSGHIPRLLGLIPGWGVCRRQLLDGSLSHRCISLSETVWHVQGTIQHGMNRFMMNF